jgi:hypothetical protein
MSERARLIQLADDLRREVGALDSIVAEARRCLADLGGRDPTSLELRGLGDILHDFYNAVEHYLERVALELNGGLPAGSDWHSTLLARMARELPGTRPAVLSPRTVEALDEYLRFQHLFRHGYGLRLQWAKLRPLLQGLDELGRELSTELAAFAAAVERLGSGLAEPG